MCRVKIAYVLLREILRILLLAKMLSNFERRSRAAAAAAVRQSELSLKGFFQLWLWPADRWREGCIELFHPSQSYFALSCHALGHCTLASTGVIKATGNKWQREENLHGKF